METNSSDEEQKDGHYACPCCNTRFVVAEVERLKKEINDKDDTIRELSAKAGVIILKEE